MIRPTPERPSRARMRLGAVLLVTLLMGSVPEGGAVASARPSADLPSAIPVGEDGQFLSNLSAPVLAPGGSGSIGYTVKDPLPVPLQGITLTLAIYRFDPSLSGTPGPVPTGGIGLGGSPAGATEWNRTIATLDPGGSVGGSVVVAAGGGAPVGSYFVRTALSFSEGGNATRFESRGYFPGPLWARATLPNGTGGRPGLNLSVLGVDGVTPETSVGVVQDSWGGVLPVLVGVGLLLAGLGAFVYYRRGPGSSSGAGTGADPQRAPSAFGK